MRKRSKIPYKKSKKNFSKTAQRVHKKNGLGGSGYAMRGGIRL